MYVLTLEAISGFTLANEHFMLINTKLITVLLSCTLFIDI